MSLSFTARGLKFRHRVCEFSHAPPYPQLRWRGLEEGQQRLQEAGLDPATLMATRGMETAIRSPRGLLSVQKLGGRRTLSMLQRYGHLAPAICALPRRFAQSPSRPLRK